MDILAEEPGADLREITPERLLEGPDAVLPETAERDLPEIPEFLLTVADGFLFIVVPDLLVIRLELLSERLEELLLLLIVVGLRKVPAFLTEDSPVSLLFFIDVADLRELPDLLTAAGPDTFL